MRSYVAAVVVTLGLCLHDVVSLPIADDPLFETSLDPVTAPVEMVDMPSDLAAMVEWSLELFAQAGLDLPSVRFVHHGGNKEPCRGRDGLHHNVDGVNVIEVCATEPSFPTKVMILHETAHAWADHRLTPQIKAEFQALRGWVYWRNYELAAWHENGTEQAAEIMVWGLIDRPLKMVRINDTSCNDLESGYVILTGAMPLNGFRDHC